MLLKRRSFFSLFSCSDAFSSALLKNAILSTSVMLRCIPTVIYQNPQIPFSTRNRDIPITRPFVSASPDVAGSAPVLPA